VAVVFPDSFLGSIREGEVLVEETVRQKLLEYIDKEVIADVILECLTDYGIDITFETAREVWLGMCDDLADEAKEVIKWRL
jgi:hypothetical protein